MQSTVENSSMLLIIFVDNSSTSDPCIYLFHPFRFSDVTGLIIDSLLSITLESGSVKVSC